MIRHVKQEPRNTSTKLTSNTSNIHNTHNTHSTRRTLSRALPCTLTVIALLIVWQVWVEVAHIPVAVFSSPTEILRATIEAWPTLQPALLITAYEGFMGFFFACVLGILLGVACYSWRALNDAVFPLLSAAQTMPLISIAPLFLLWFGFEPLGKIVIVTVFALFPIAVQTIRGLQSVPQFFVDVALTCGATRTWTLWHVQLRVAARQIFGGIRISAAYVFATAATAEYLGARAGLGIWLQAAYNSFRTPLIFSATFVIIALTGILLLLIHIVERIALGPDERWDGSGQ